MSAQIVVVTGASGGIGRAVANGFADRGATVVLIARGETGLAAAAEDVRARGGTPVVIATDVADSAAIFAAAQQVEEKVGPIDTWINVAFTSVFAPFDQIQPDEFKRVTEVSYLGYVYATMAALSHMKPRDRRTIVQVGSALAYRGIPLQTAYCGAKHAIQRFNEALRCAAARQERRAHHDGANAGSQHPPIFVGAIPPAGPGATRPAYLPAGVRRPGRAVCRRPPTPTRILGRVQHHGNPRRERPSTRPARPLPRLGRLQVTADWSAASARRPRQPVGTSRRTKRKRLRCPRNLLVESP